jgi:hypothetical protein
MIAAASTGSSSGFGGSAASQCPTPVEPAGRRGVPRWPEQGWPKAGAIVEGYREFIGPIVGSNLLAVGPLALAWWRPTVARATIGVGFLVQPSPTPVVVTVNEAIYIDCANWAAGPYARLIEKDGSRTTRRRR